MTHSLLITLQSHYKSNNPGQPIDRKRYGCDDRQEISKRSLYSLIKTINFLIKNAVSPIEVTLKILDDHSDQDHLDFISEQIKHCNAECHIINLSTTGLMESLEQCYLIQREFDGLVYLAQDDYLYDEKCLFEMVDAYFNFGNKIKNHPIIYPFDDPYYYYDFNIVPTRIVLSRYRHWRTLNGGSCAYLTHSDVIKLNWDLYMKFIQHPLVNLQETNTINKIVSERGYHYFCPIPTLAIHFQHDTEKHPLVDWEEFWENSNYNK